MLDCDTGKELPRTKRCLSSGSSSLSSASVSKASARSELTLCLVLSVDDERERNDGGGELGILRGWREEGVSGSSSCVFTRS